MRIAIDARFVQDHFPGIGRYTYNLIRHLALVTDDPLIILHNPALRNSRYDIAALAETGNISLVRSGARTFSVSEQWRLSVAALRKHADLLHTPYYMKPYLPALPSVSTIYDAISALYPEYLPSRFARLIFDVTMRLALGTSRRVLTLSQCSRDDLTRLYGTAAQKIVVTHLAPDPNYRPLEPASCAPLRDKYALPEQFALYVGINKPHKNLTMLVEALAIARHHGDIRLVIAGAHDPRWPQVEQAVARLGLGDAVKLLPNVPEPELPLLFNLAKCFVFPSLYEGFGLPPLEAMACGTPVICSNRSALPEVVGDAAILVDPTDVARWAGALLELWESTALREDLATRGLARAGQFTWQDTARKTLEAYREALAA
jgi:alpha-1,3-rhamnosyl/mannosyltransferase